MADLATYFDKIGEFVLTKGKEFEQAFQAYLAENPHLQEKLADFGTREDLLTMTMIGLVVSLVVLLAALIKIRPRRSHYVLTTDANEKLLFPKYAYSLTEHERSEAH